MAEDSKKKTDKKAEDKKKEEKKTTTKKEDKKDDKKKSSTKKKTTKKSTKKDDKKDTKAEKKEDKKTTTKKEDKKDDKKKSSTKKEEKKDDKKEDKKDNKSDKKDDKSDKKKSKTEAEKKVDDIKETVKENKTGLFIAVISIIILIVIIYLIFNFLGKGKHNDYNRALKDFCKTEEKKRNDVIDEQVKQIKELTGEEIKVGKFKCEFLTPKEVEKDNLKEVEDLYEKLNDKKFPINKAYKSEVYLESDKKLEKIKVYAVEVEKEWKIIEIDKTEEKLNKKED